MSISHAMIMIRDVSLRMNHAIQKDIVNTLRAMNLLSDIL